MKKPDKLKLRAVGNKLINDHDALDAGTCRYIGRKWDSSLKGYPATEPSVVRPLPEYVIAVQNGDLAPADEATAKYCGVPFISEPEATEPAIPNDTLPYDGKF
jgi:hypothetical protein